MATETFALKRETAFAHADELSDTNTFTIAASDFSVDAIELEVYTFGGSCDVLHLIDAAGDFSNPDTSITLDSFSSSGVSEHNQTPIVSGLMAVQIKNTSGGKADYAVYGQAVSGHE